MAAGVYSVDNPGWVFGALPALAPATLPAAAPAAPVIANTASATYTFFDLAPQPLTPAPVAAGGANAAWTCAAHRAYARFEARTRALHRVRQPSALYAMCLRCVYIYMYTIV
jgi:hypothetical protein